MKPAVVSAADGSLGPVSESANGKPANDGDGATNVADGAAAAPANATITPSRTIERMTLPRPAPSASRMPISFVRRDTANAECHKSDCRQQMASDAA